MGYYRAHIFHPGIKRITSHVGWLEIVNKHFNLETMEDARRYVINNLKHYGIGTTVSIEYVPDNRFIVVGFTDGRGRWPYYDDLQVRPIIELEDWLMAKYTIIVIKRKEESAVRFLKLIEARQEQRDIRAYAKRNGLP